MVLFILELKEICELYYLYVYIYGKCEWVVTYVLIGTILYYEEWYPPFYWVVPYVMGGSILGLMSGTLSKGLSYLHDFYF